MPPAGLYFGPSLCESVRVCVCVCYSVCVCVCVLPMLAYRDTCH